MRTLRLLIIGTVLLALLWGVGAGAAQPGEDTEPEAGAVAAEQNEAEVAWAAARDGVFVDRRKWENSLWFGVDAIRKKQARRLRRTVREHLALLEGLPDYVCYVAARASATDAAELLDEGLTDIIEGRRRRADHTLHVGSLRLDEYWGLRDAVDCSWAVAFRQAGMQAAPARTQAEAEADLLARFPTAVASEPIAVEAFTGPEWIERLIAGGMDAATARARVEGLVGTFGASPEDLTLATALIERNPLDVGTITALQVAGVGTDEWSKPDVAGFVGLDYWWDLHIGDKPVTRFRDASLPGSYPLTVVPGTKGTVWVLDAQRPLLVDVMGALEGESTSITATAESETPWSGERVEVPELGVAVTFPADWTVDVAPEPERGYGNARGLGPLTMGWSVASGRMTDPGDDEGTGGCGLVLYRPTELPLHEAMEQLIDDRDQTFRKLGPLDGGMYGYVGPYEFYGSRREMAFYALASGDAIATLMCLDDQAPPDHWRSIAESIELVPIDERRWLPLFAPSEQAWSSVAPEGSLVERLDTPAGSDGTKVKFVVKRRHSIEDIAKRLVKAGLLTDAQAFLYLVAREGLDEYGPRAGTYRLTGRMSPRQVVARLAGEPDPAKATMDLRPRRGRRIEEVAVALQRQTTWRRMGWPELELDAEEFARLARDPAPELRDAFGFLRLAPEGASLEGFLVPGRYEVPVDITAGELIHVMLERWPEKYGDLVAEASAKGLDFYEVLIIASLVEREAREKDDRSRIAGVYWNRLDPRYEATGSLVQADPAVVYATDSMGLEDLDIERWSDYVFWDVLALPALSTVEVDDRLRSFQTYRSEGLPEHPIVTPTRKSIRAALDPDTEQGYLYLHACPGSDRHVFAKTFAQHEENVASCE